MFEELKKFLVNDMNIKDKEITMGTKLAADLGINSIDFAEFIINCEEKFNVVIEDEDLHKFVTVGDIVTYLEAKTA